MSALSMQFSMKFEHLFICLIASYTVEKGSVKNAIKEIKLKPVNSLLSKLMRDFAFDHSQN